MSPGFMMSGTPIKSAVLPSEKPIFPEDPLRDSRTPVRQFWYLIEMLLVISCVCQLPSSRSIRAIGPCHARPPP